MTGFERLARNFEQAIPKVITGASKAAYLTAQDGRQWAIFFSSGTVTTAQLRVLNHPYGLGSSGPKGIRGPVPYGDASIINAQSGKFRDDWVVYVNSKGIGLVTGLVSYGVKNVDPIASFLQFGTRKMVARPLEVGLTAFMQKAYVKHLDDLVSPVIRQALTPVG